MTRSDKLRQLAAVLKLAAKKARSIAESEQNGASRETALAIQLEGIAMEFEIIALETDSHI